MTARERATLRDQLARRRLPAKRPVKGRLRHLNPVGSLVRCVYCGHWARHPACFLHVDLLALDPKYATADAGTEAA